MRLRYGLLSHESLADPCPLEQACTLCPFQSASNSPRRCADDCPLSPYSNLVRTRLQAQGTPAHPQTYTGIRDAALKCYQREGWRGFYKGVSRAGLSSERVEG